MNIKEIQKQFNDVIIHSQGYQVPINTDPLFDKWYENKSWIIERMDEKLIWESEEKVSFLLGEKEKKERLDSFLEEIIQENFPLYHFIVDNYDGFYSNKTIHETKVNKRTIPKGMKLSKAFKFFENDPKNLDKWQTKMSMLLQENKIEGTLCISVHPLDFLSLSENQHNWRSCHALDGDFRAGNLSYMLDKSTVICYLKSDKEVILPRFPENVKWNSKKWRMLLFFSEDREGMIAGRQYPFFNRGALDEVMSLLKKTWLLTTHHWRPWTNYQLNEVNINNQTFRLRYPHIFIKKRLYPITDIVKDKGSLHFNDVLLSSCYTPYYSFTIFTLREDKPPIFYIGEEVPCLYCGKEEITMSESMLCNDCEINYGTVVDGENITTCSCCGCRIFIDDDSTYVTRDGQYICDTCLYDNYTQCDYCLEWVPNDNITYQHKEDRYICEYCEGED